MVKVRTPGREAFRNSTENPTPVLSKHDNENLSSYKVTTPTKKKKSILKKYETPKRNKPKYATPETPLKSHNVTPETPLKSRQANEVIEDDEDDDLLSKADFSCIQEICIQEEERSENLRRSKRSRRVVSQEGFVPTVDVVPMKGDIPLVDASSLHIKNTKVNGTVKQSYQNSLSSLLREKKLREKVGYNINAMEKILMNDMLDEMEDPYDSYDRLEISASILNEDIKCDQLQQIFEEDYEHDQNYQIEFFETLHSNPQISNLQSCIPAIDDLTFDLLLRVSSDKKKLKDILCSDWIAHRCEIGWQLPIEIMIWLLHLVSYEEDEIISEASFNTLKNIAEIKKNFNVSLNDEVENACVPFLEVYNILATLGASTHMISLRCCLENNTRQSSICEVPSEFHYFDNIRLLLKTLVPMIDSRLFTFSNSEEIRKSIIVLLRLPLDKRLMSLSNEVEQVVISLLAMFQEDQWMEQAKLICNEIEFSCGSITQFKVAIIENLPITNRGRLLKHFLAVRFLIGCASPLPQQMDIINVMQPGILNTLLYLFQDHSTIFKIKDDTNYNELYHHILLLSYALDDEALLRKAKETVEEIIKMLKILHGKIVDMRAAFMDRTKTKDLIQRLYVRLYYISSRQGEKTQSSLLVYSPKKTQKTSGMYLDHEEN
ncbi:4920_t:CDS:10 [Funneliformis caledonium]|uniref:4920_t:CDS:1 n=1 Tax=Funneliformis caledonium TaxID=1117310 RepID=A0A9N9F2R9_9GLOM|nr:4920_t:CDS:10 [Funneliformis caledonium]